MRQSSRSTTLLQIDSSVLGDHSVSRRMSAALVEQWRGADPTVTVVYRDLGAQPPAVKVLYQIGGQMHSPAVDKRNRPSAEGASS